MISKYARFVVHVAIAALPFVAINSAYAGLGCWSNSGTAGFCAIDTTSCGEGSCDGACIPDGAGGTYCLGVDCELCLPPGESCTQAFDSGVLASLDVQSVLGESSQCYFATTCGVLAVGSNATGTNAPWADGDYCYLDAINHETPSAWMNGDCDGDGEPNASDLGDICLPVVDRVGDSLSTITAPWHRSKCGVAGSREVGGGVCATRGVAIGCQMTCPVGPEGAGVCAFDAAHVLGACLYPDAPAAPFVTAPCLTNAGCVDSRRADAYRAWADGDCDRDMQANEIDPDICVSTPGADSGAHIDAAVARADAGAAPEGTTFTGGGGVVCSASLGRAKGRASGLGLTVLSLLALVVVRRRRSLAG